MSEQTVSCTSGVEIYVPLLNEGTDVCRPTTGLPLGDMRYQVLPAPGYNAETEDGSFRRAVWWSASLRNGVLARFSSPEKR